jgi:hypothetical protein
MSDEFEFITPIFHYKNVWIAKSYPLKPKPMIIPIQFLLKNYGDGTLHEHVHLKYVPLPLAFLLLQ